MLLRLLSLLIFFGATVANGQNSPCYWSGQYVKCFPTNGIFLDKQRGLFLGDSGTTNYVELKAPVSVTTYVLTYPLAQGASGQVLSNDGSGNYSWVSPVLTSRNINTTAPLTGGGNLSADLTLGIAQSGVATDGYLSSTDWNTFNNKVPATRSISTIAPLTGGGDLSANRTLAITQSGVATDGYLSSTDWNTFNNKQPAGSYITSLIGDVTASGPGAAAATVAKIQGTTVSGTTGTGNVVFGTSPTMSDPVVGTQSQSDASTKAASTAYVTTAIANAVAGVNPAVAVQAATTGSGDTSGFTYNNGVSGIGATLTSTSNNTPLTVDGYTFTALGQRLLVKDNSTSANNGVYYVTQLQAALLPIILTRTLDFDTPSDMNNTGAIPVENGTVNQITQWVLTSLVNTVGTDPVTFTKFTRNPADYLLKANNLSDVSSTSTSFNNISPMTTQGDLIYENGTPSGTRLAAGATTQLLHSGTTPSWSAVSLTADTSGVLPETKGGTNQSTYTTGDMLYASAPNTLAKLPIGSAAQVLTVSGGIPSWQTGGTVATAGLLTTDQLSSTLTTIASGTSLTYPRIDLNSTTLTNNGTLIAYYIYDSGSGGTVVGTGTVVGY